MGNLGKNSDQILCVNCLLVGLILIVGPDASLRATVYTLALGAHGIIQLVLGECCALYLIGIVIQALYLFMHTSFRRCSFLKWMRLCEAFMHALHPLQNFPESGILKFGDLTQQELGGKGN